MLCESRVLQQTDANGGIAELRMEFDNHSVRFRQYVRVGLEKPLFGTFNVAFQQIDALNICKMSR